LEGQSLYEIPYELNLSVGVYVMILETPRGSTIRKIVIK